MNKVHLTLLRWNDSQHEAQSKLFVHECYSSRHFRVSAFRTICLSQVRAHQLVLPPCDVVIKAVADYVRSIPDITDLETIGKDIFKNSQV